MPDLLRSIIERFRGSRAGMSGEHRRASPRHRAQCEARLLLSQSLVNARPGDGRTSGPLTIPGRTRDLSASGMAVIVASPRLVDLYLTGENFPLLVELHLPTGTIEVQVVTVRYEDLGKKGGQTGCLIAVRIVEMSDAEWKRYFAYLRTLP
jgi:hypothetical protein